MKAAVVQVSQKVQVNKNSAGVFFSEIIPYLFNEYRNLTRDAPNSPFTELIKQNPSEGIGINASLTNLANSSVFATQLKKFEIKDTVGLVKLPIKGVLINVIEVDVRMDKFEVAISFISEEIDCMDSIGNHLLLSLTATRNTSPRPTFLLEIGGDLSIWSYS